MKSAAFLLPLLLLAGPSPAQVAQPVPAPAPQSRQTGGLLPATQALYDGYVRARKMPGIVGAFGVGDLPTVYVAAGRIATDPAARPADPDTLWRIYSMTKPITGMAAMMLVEEGKIGLDDPVSKYIPAFARMRVATSPATSLASVPAQRPITIRHLLTHSSGLGYHITAKGPLLKEYERLGLLPYAVSPAVEAKMRAARPRTLEEFANRVAAAPLVAQPGTAWNYSMGLDVMGRVIEVASGMPFDRFLSLRLFGPLGMRSTYFTVPGIDRDRLATSYAILGKTFAPVDTGPGSVFLQSPSFPYGGAGLVSSARDYDRFLAMLANGGSLGVARVLKPETVRLALSNLLPAGVTFGGAGAITGVGGTARLGFGAGGFVTLVDQPGGLRAGSYGWNGAAGTVAWVDPARRTRATIMVNYSPGTLYPLAQETGRALASDLTRLRP